AGVRMTKHRTNGPPLSRVGENDLSLDEGDLTVRILLLPGRPSEERFQRFHSVTGGNASGAAETIRAVQVAAHHDGGEGVAAGVDGEERLRLDGVTLKPGDVTEGDREPAGVVEADLADPAQAVADEAAVPTGQAADATGLGPAQLGRPLGGEPVEQVGQRPVCHSRRLHPCLLPLPHARPGTLWLALRPPAGSASLSCPPAAAVVTLDAMIENVDVEEALSRPQTQPASPAPPFVSSVVAEAL